MNYSIYKLEFQTGVHFGTGMLNESAYTFQADQLFSALYIEALKLDCADTFYSLVHSGKLLFSDAFPYIGQQYMIPKPMSYTEPPELGKSKKKKLFKKMQFIPVDALEEFVSGIWAPSEDPMEDFGSFSQQTMAHVRREDDTLPYRVGTYYYQDGCGLYLIVSYETEEEKYLLEDLLISLSYAGIGGKKASGLGKYELKHGKMPEALQRHLEKESGEQLLLCTALPADSELEQALDGAKYQLIRRSGYVASVDYADEWRKKRDLYVFSAGSCFAHTFTGDIFDVSNGGKHPVYRYAKALFMGV